MNTQLVSEIGRAVTLGLTNTSHAIHAARAFPIVLPRHILILQVHLVWLASVTADITIISRNACSSRRIWLDSHTGLGGPSAVALVIDPGYNS